MTTHYCDTISNALALSLATAGMKVDFIDDSVEERPNEQAFHCETIYAEVFDWLSEKGIYLENYPSQWYNLDRVSWYFCPFGKAISTHKETELSVYKPTWKEAADTVIERVLELIKANKEEKK